MAIRIVIAQEHGVLRSALRALLESVSDFEIAAEVSSPDELVSAVPTAAADVILMDCCIHRRLALTEAWNALLAQPGPAMVVLGMCHDEPCVQRLLRTGVRGYVLKTSSDTELIQAIQRVHGGDWYIDSSLSQFVTLPPAEERERAPQKAFAGLTDRELEVCRLLAYGYTNLEIAEQLSVSGRTVEAHRARIMSKLKFRNRADLVRFALHHGLLQVHL
jgi:two-component system response regulator NreC